MSEVIPPNGDIQKPLEQNNPQSKYSLLFSSEFALANPEQRKALALDFINHFSMRQLNEADIQDAGMQVENIPLKNLHSARDLSLNPALYELQSRANYAQYIFTQGDTSIQTYDRLTFQANINPATADLIMEQPNLPEIIVRIQEPFFYDRRKNMVRQYDPDDKQALFRAGQIFNQASSIAGSKPRTPSGEMVGLLYFKPPQAGTSPTK